MEPFIPRFRHQIFLCVVCKHISLEEGQWICKADNKKRIDFEKECTLYENCQQTGEPHETTQQ